MFPAGRLDKDTTGFLILTDDGAFAHRMLAPRSHVDKVYEAELDKPVTREDQDRFAKGMDLGDFISLPAEMERLPPMGTLHKSSCMKENSTR